MNRAPTALGDIVRAFKARVTLAIRRETGMPDLRVWQRNYHEHIVRDVASLERIRGYIASNPANWAR